MYYPVFLNLRGKDCVVFGGGEIALRKVRALMDCGARTSVYAPEVIPELEKLAQDGKIILEKKPYEPDDLVGSSLVICATNDREVNAAISREAQARGLLVNVVDDPELCNFIAPSILRRGRLVIAVSTGGTSPAMAKRVRAKLEKEFGQEYELFLEAMDQSRKKIQTSLPTEDLRKEFFTRLVHSNLIDQIRSKISSAKGEISPTGEPQSGGLGWDSARVEKAIEEQLEKFLAYEVR